MVIKGLNQFLVSNELIRTESLKELRGTRLCIDAHLWLKQPHLRAKLLEPWCQAMGGIPLGLQQVVEDEVKKFAKAGIYPVFVFNGINLQQMSEGKPLQPEWVRTQGRKQYDRREKGWEEYKNGKIETAKQLFKSAGSVTTTGEFLNSLVACFRNANVQFFRAPYLAWAQLAWFASKREGFGNIWGDEEVLLFTGLVQCERAILHVDLEKEQFQYVSLPDVLAKLGGISVSQFVDCCIIMGFQRSFIKGLSSSTRHQPRDEGGWTDDSSNEADSGPEQEQYPQFHDIYEVAQGLAQSLPHHRNGASYLDARARSDPNFVSREDQKYLDTLWDNFMRLKNLIHHHVILTLEGHVIPISYHNADPVDISMRQHSRNPFETKVPITMQQTAMNDIVPANLRAILGPRLPSLVYVFLASGLLSPQVVNNVVHNFMVEYLPTVDTQEYRDLLQKVVPLRTQIAYLLIFCFQTRDESFWKTKRNRGNRSPMSCAQWHSELPIPLHTPPDLSLDDWDIQWNPESEKRMRDANQQLAINFKSVMIFANRAHKSNPGGRLPEYKKVEEIVCTILLKILDLLGYFTHPQNQRPAVTECSGMSVFAETINKHFSWQHAERGVLFIELLRTGALTANIFSAPAARRTGDRTTITPQNPAPVTEDMEPRRILVTRVFSVLPCTTKHEAWQGEFVSRDLCAFNVLVRSLHKTLRNLSEIVTVLLFLENKVAMHDHQGLSTLLQEITKRLPFGDSLHTGLGVVIHYILKQAAQSPDRSAGDAPKHYTPEEAQRNWNELDLESKFPSCINLREDLKRAVQFWKEAMHAVNSLSDAGVQRQQQLQFQDASKLLDRVAEKYGFTP